MQSKFFPSSPQAASGKRGFADELQDSPTAKRAKRAKHSKKRRSKEPKGDKDADDYVEQQDWVLFDNSSVIGSPVRKEAAIYPPPPFPLKQAHKHHVLKSAEKGKGGSRTDTEENGDHTMSDAQDGVNNAAAQESSKAEANTRKTRAEPETKSSSKQVTGNGSTIPAVPGPSKIKASKKQRAQEPKELTPLSDLAPPTDYTFKAFPNPPPIDFSSAKKSSKKGASKETDRDSNGVANTVTAKEIEPEASPPPIEEGLAAPAGTKTLKAINKHLKALEAKLTAVSQPDQTTTSSTETQSLRTELSHLHARLDRAELRASIRHEMLFNALVKVSTDVCALSSLIHDQRQATDDNDHNDGAATDGENTTTTGATTAATPRPNATAAARDKRIKMMQQSRKTYEQCLRNFTTDMDRAASREEVAKFGGLCVQYAGDLFKTLG